MYEHSDYLRAYVRQFEEFLFSQGIFLLLRQFQVSRSLFSEEVANDMDDRRVSG